MSFEVYSPNTGTQITATIHATTAAGTPRTTLTLSKAAHAALGDPTTATILFDPDTMTLAIRADGPTNLRRDGRRIPVAIHGLLSRYSVDPIAGAHDAHLDGDMIVVGGAFVARDATDDKDDDKPTALRKVS